MTGSGLLLRLEDAGIDSLHIRGELFDVTLYREALHHDELRDLQLLERTGTLDAAERLQGLGARLVYCLTDAPDGGKVIVGEAGQGGSTGTSIVVELVESHAARPDNVTKLLSAADRSERHLFVWVESSQHGAVAAMGFGGVLADRVGLPDRSPRLPDCIDVVWVVTAYEVAHAWRFDRAAGWQNLGNVALRSHPDSTD